MKIHLRGRTLLWMLAAMIAAATLVTCGKVKGNTPDGPVGDDCVWDQSQWDGCKLSP
ncbi:MAG: hypothetical protein H0V17_22465 [Deltaproteobacteria bacterium]|nr:hypothetical protein [Deltaproteobacteria bacterium]